MSLVPVNQERGITTADGSSEEELWNPGDLFSALDFWEPFPFPSMLSTHFPSIFPPSSMEAQFNWRETPGAYVFRAVFNREDVLVYIDDDNMLQVSSENGDFMTKFKLPENSRRDQIKAAMANGVLTIKIPKEGDQHQRPNPNVRTIEISGSG